MFIRSEIKNENLQAPNHANTKSSRDPGRETTLKTNPCLSVSHYLAMSCGEPRCVLRVLRVSKTAAEDPTVDGPKAARASSFERQRLPTTHMMSSSEKTSAEKAETVAAGSRQQPGFIPALRQVWSRNSSGDQP